MVLGPFENLTNLEPDPLPKENHQHALIVKKGPPPAFKPHLPAPQRSTVLRAGSWRIFTLDRIFYMMIIGREMADIRHGGGGRTVPFSGFVWSGVFLGDRARAKKFSVLAFLSFCGP